MTEHTEAVESIYKAWKVERERNAKLYRALDRCLTLLNMEAERRDGEGRDSLAIRKTVDDIRKELFS